MDAVLKRVKNVLYLGGEAFIDLSQLDRGELNYRLIYAITKTLEDLVGTANHLQGGSEARDAMVQLHVNAIIGQLSSGTDKLLNTLHEEIEKGVAAATAQAIIDFANKEVRDKFVTSATLKAEVAEAVQAARQQSTAIEDVATNAVLEKMRGIGLWDRLCFVFSTSVLDQFNTPARYQPPAPKVKK